MSNTQSTHHDALSDEQVAEVFHGAGVRVTRQRTLIYSSLASTDAHPTAEDLLETIRTIDDRVSLATVYNTLETLTEHGLVHRIPGEGSGTACRYDAETSPHVHMVMDDGVVADVPHDLSEQIIDSIPPAVLEQLAKRMGVQVTGIKIDLACIAKSAGHSN